MPTLSPERLPHLPAAIAQPRFDRSKLRPGIVHLGLGAFVRAFMLPLLDAALHRAMDLSTQPTHDAPPAHPAAQTSMTGQAPCTAAPSAYDPYAWGVIGYSLRQPDTRDALTPQQGLYTLLLRDAEPSELHSHATPSNAPTLRLRERYQVIGSLMSAEFATDTPHPIDAQIASPDTRIVSLTLTEKGYLGTSAIDALPCLLRGLRLRHAKGLPPVTVLSLDNLSCNGQTTRARLLALQDADAGVGVFEAAVEHLMGNAALPDRQTPETAGFRDWLADQCRYPCSMVDRIVPATTDREREAVRAHLHADDAWPVVAEPYLHWVLEDDFAQGRPDWPGVTFVASRADVLQWEANKLRMVNGAHSMLAYLAVAAAWSTVDQAMAAPGMRQLLTRLLFDEVIPSLLDHRNNADGAQQAALQRYGQAILDRFSNPALAHQTHQIAMDGSQKLPLRLIPTAASNLATGRPIACVALALAAWIQYQRGHNDAGRSYPVLDPQAAELNKYALAAPPGHSELVAAAGTATASPTDADALAAYWCAYQPVFGDLHQAPAWRQAVATALAALQSAGAATVVAGFRD